MPRPSRAVLGTILALAAGAAVVVMANHLPSSARSARKRIAVAVFSNRTGDSTLEPLGTMAADWITRGMDRLDGVEVIDVGTLHAQGRSDAGVPVDPVVLARQNGAGTVVSGSYYLATDTLVIRSSIVDATSGTVLRTVPTVHAEPDQAVQALDQLRQQVGAALAGTFDVRLTSVTGGPAVPRTFAAYEAFVAGQSAYWQGKPIAEVRAHFSRAAAADSMFRAAGAWLAFVGANGGGCDLTDSVSRALEPYRAELGEFDRLTLDVSMAKCRNDWREGFRLARQQAALRPRSTYAVYTAGVFGVFSGHFQEAVEQFASIDPRHDLGWLTDPAKLYYWRYFLPAEHYAGDYAAELRNAERLAGAFPGQPVARVFAARALAAHGRGAEAIAHLDAALALPPEVLYSGSGGDHPLIMALFLAGELRVHGDSAAAVVAAERGLSWHAAHPEGQPPNPYSRYFLARLYAMLGRYDEAAAAVAFRQRASDDDPLYLGLEGMLAAYRNASAVADEADRRLAAMAEPMLAPVVAIQRARIAAARGQVDRAVTLLEAADRQGFVRVPIGLDPHLDPAFDPLRQDARFRAIAAGRH